MRPVDPRLLRASRPARAHLVVASCLAAVAAVAIVAQAVLLAAAVAGAVDGSRSVEGVLVVLAVVVVARALVDGAFDAVGRFGAARVMSDLRGRLAEQFLVRRPDGLDTPRVGELSALAVQGVDAVEPYFARFLPQLALSAFVPVAVLAWLVPLAWLPALVLALTLPLIPLFMVLVGMATRARTERRWQTLSVLSAHFLDVVRGLPTLRAHARDRAQAETLGRVGDAYRRETLGTLRIAFLSAFVLEALAMLGTALVAGVIGVQLAGGHLSLQAGLTVLLLAPELYAPLRAVGAQFHASADGLTALQKLQDAIADPPAISAPSAPAPSARAPVATPRVVGPSEPGVATPRVVGPPEPGVATPRVVGPPEPGVATPRVVGPPEPGVATPRVVGPLDPAVAAPRVVGRLDPAVAAPDPGGSEVRLAGVAFAYPGGSPVLEAVDLVLPAGATTAIVGPSGAGKSTLAKLVLRLADPTGGAVSCGGVDLRDVEPAAWRGRCAYVPQRPRLFAGTVADNLRLGREEASAAELWSALEAAGAAALVGSLPDALDTPVGETGRTLSSGEAQRLVIARAFVRDAPLLVLDEPTAHLDEAAAVVVEDALDRLRAGRTTLLVAHRPALAERADHVVMLDAGRVAEAVAA